MQHLSNDHEDGPNQHKNNNRLCDEMGDFEFLRKSVGTETTA